MSDAQNLKKDLALQRLLKESHLLDHKSPSSPYGQNRHKAIDLRLQELGTKSSLYHQRNMPMSQRKGIAAKASGREESRRKEAKENGVILARATKGKKDIIDTKRQRGIGAPSVGRFKGGMLTLSKRDVIEIQGRKKTTKGKRWLGLCHPQYVPDADKLIPLVDVPRSPLSMTGCSFGDFSWAWCQMEDSYLPTYQKSRN